MRKKGISLISMSIVIAIMIILLSTISISLTFSITNAKKLTFAKEMYNIQSIVDEYALNEGTLFYAIESIEVTPTDLTQFQGEIATNGKILLETIELSQLGIKNTNYGNKELGNNESEKAKDVYAVSKNTGRVYYIAGFKSNGKVYYTLTEELREMIEKKQNLNIAEETITFTANKSGWSKDAITVKVTVPDDYTSSSISINNANIQYSSSTENGVTYYNINTSNVLESYTVTINCAKNGITSTATYVAKIDKTNPVISKDVSASNSTVVRLNAIDNESGVKYFKYVEGVIQSENAREYIYAYGRKVSASGFKSGNNYTVYAEDNAGNYVVIYIDATGNLTNDIT